MTVRRVIEIDAGQVEAASALLAVITYYDKLAEARRFATALRALELRDRLDSDPDREWQPQPIVWGLARLPPEWVESTVDRGLDILVTRRILAADEANTLLLKKVCDTILVPVFDLSTKAPTGEMVPLPVMGAHGKVISGKTQAEAHAAQLLADLRRRRSGRAGARLGPEQLESARRNVKTRAWNETKPVLHLALALRGFVLEHHPEADTMPTLDILRTLPVASIVWQAEAMAPAIAAEHGISGQVTVAVR